MSTRDSSLSSEHVSLVERNDLTLDRPLIDNLSRPEVKKSVSPCSLPGTGSSVASASDHSEVSDLESDSGIENSHANTASPEISQVSPLTQSSDEKGVCKGHHGVVCGSEESCREHPGKLKEVSMAWIISCLDDKVSVCYICRIKAPNGYSVQLGVRFSHI